MRYLFIFFVFLLFFIFPQKIWAQVYINEFSSYESQGDWIELYATEDTDISNWVLRDTSVSKMKTIPEGTTIGPSTSQYFTLDVGNRLNRDGDKIELRQADDSTVVDQVWYGDSNEVCPPETGQSAGKTPDGTGVWRRFSSQSKNAANTQGTSPCANQNTPNPTVAPTPTPTPTLSPTPRPTEQATVAPQIQAATSSSSPTPIPRLNADNTDTKIVSAETAQESSPPYVSYLLVLAGISSIGAGFYPFAKKWLKEYNKPHDPTPPTYF